MNIYKLQFTNKAESLVVLQDKGVLVPFEDEFIYGEGVQAVVELGIICLDPNAEPPIYADGYHYDVMAEQVIDFGVNLIEPKNPKHAFAGYNIHQEYVPETQAGI